MDVPFDIPENWRWVRLGDVVVPESGLAYKKEDLAIKSKSMVRVLRGGNIQDGSCIFKDDDVFIAREKIKGCTTIHAFDYVLPAVTSQVHLGKTAFFQGDYEDVCAGGFLLMLHLIYKDINFAKYLLLYFQCRTYKDYCKTIANKSGQAFFNLSRQKLVQALFPLPPLAEQKRIVAKIEKLMPLVEEYGKMEETRLQLDADLPATLEKSILQEAIQGKLVPQDPNDEPASELLKRIAVERKTLIKAGKLKRDKSESVIFRGSDRLAYETRNDETVCIQDEIPFEIPDSWEWVRLGNITTFLHRGKSPTYVPHSDCPMLAQKCNQWDGIHLEKCKFCDETKFKTFQDEYHLRDHDIVVNSTGTGTLGRVGIFHDSELAKHGYLSIVPDSHVTVVRTSLHDLSQYIYHYLCTKFCWEWMNNNADGSTKQKELYTSTLASLLIPIPPLAEQRRIASAIPLLFNNCNQLKQQSTM